jgi:hypothetical protein
VRVLVCGDRHYDSEDYVHLRLDEQDARQPTGLSHIIDGTAAGADTFGYTWRMKRGRSGQRFRPHWRHDEGCEPGCVKPQGRKAGVLRNQQMLDEGKPDLVIAFHDNIAESRGTRDMINRSVKAGILTILYDGGAWAKLVTGKL